MITHVLIESLAGDHTVTGHNGEASWKEHLEAIANENCEASFETVLHNVQNSGGHDEGPDYTISVHCVQRFDSKLSPRCEGWRRHGGAFTLGPVQWEQCRETPLVRLKVLQDGVESNLPACHTCWKEALANASIEVLSVRPL